MTRKEQNKILDDKIESNINQYKVDRLNAEMSAFSSGDLNKYQFLTRKDLKYKPNALDKERFAFSSLGKTLSIGLDKTAQGYQKKGIIKLLKNIRDSLSGDNGPNNRPNNRSNNRPNNDDNDNVDDNRLNNDDGDRPNNNYGDRPNNDDGDRPNNDYGDRPNNDDNDNDYYKEFNDKEELEKLE